MMTHERRQALMTVSAVVVSVIVLAAVVGGAVFFVYRIFGG